MIDGDKYSNWTVYPRWPDHSTDSPPATDAAAPLPV